METPDKPLSVIERLKKMSRVNEQEDETSIVRELLNPLDTKKTITKSDLDPHFYWEIMRLRRRKGLTQERLSQILNIPILYIEKLEKGDTNIENFTTTIQKIERFFQIKMTKVDEFEEIAKRKSTSTILRDEQGNILDRIPEPEITQVEKKEKPIEIIEEEAIIESSEVKTSEPGFQKKTSFKEKFSRLFSSGFVEEENTPETIIETEIIETTTKPKQVNPYEGLKPYQMPYSRGRIGLRRLEGQQQEVIEEKVKPEEVLGESGELDIEKAKMSNVRIADLRELNKQKLHLSKQEKIQEARKIEQRQKLIEARKEELRILKEKQSKDIDSRLGGSELLKKKDIPSNQEEVDERDIDKDFNEFEKD